MAKQLNIPVLSTVLSGLLLTCWLAGTSLAQSTLPAERHIYWNISNPIFKLAGVNTLVVRKNDRVVFHCPTNGLEFYQLYWTHNVPAALACQSNASNVYRLLECSSPDVASFIIQATYYSPVPGSPSLEKTLYVYTSSTGDRAGLRQQLGGACATRNMRLAIDIGEPTDTITDATATATASSSSSSAAAAATSTPTSAASASAKVTSATSTSAASGSGGGGHGAGSVTSKNTQSPTPQDLANHAQINLIIAGSTNLPSQWLLTAALTAAALARPL